MTSSVPSPTTAVLVSGASSGIGLECTQDLIAQGCFVFAGVRREADHARLARQFSSAHCHPLLLDITDPASIQAALAIVTRQLPPSTRRLVLLHNAGYALGGPIECLSLEQVRDQFEVNVFGHVAVFMSSVAGFSVYPFGGVYCASKHALEAIADGFRMELAPWHIQVSLIQPGAIQTPLWNKVQTQASDVRDALSPEGQQHYGSAYVQVEKTVAQTVRDALPVQAVSVAVRHAVLNQTPKTRYSIGKDTQQRRWLKLLPTHIADSLIRTKMGLS
jgi:NAD(P)-dependent dehydrogenase (short-subunit alcohol dehydrogenase family)